MPRKVICLTLLKEVNPGVDIFKNPNHCLLKLPPVPQGFSFPAFDVMSGKEMQVDGRKSPVVLDSPPPSIVEVLGCTSTIHDAIALDRPLDTKQNQIVYLDLAQESQLLGRLIIELYSSITPESVRIFTSSILENVSSTPVHQRFQTHLHFSPSSTPLPVFPDENFVVRHERGTLVWCNAGPHSNDGTFMIQIADEEVEFFKGRYVGFGRVIVDSSGVLDELYSSREEDVGRLEVVAAGLWNDEKEGSAMVTKGGEKEESIQITADRHTP
ncbi:cyclophilin-like domain-containing protein [Cladochytrium replicatum]|nr:cyclophilin-like domain-containing protein [Cladochytrium replicatum]